MKVLLIGRGDNCHIQIEDSRVSRQHALLKLYPLGKIEIVDQSTNGTAVNGVRIKANVPKRVTRGDVVTFAEAVKLDWSQVPDPSRIYKIGGCALLAVAVGIALVFGLRSGRPDPLPEPGQRGMSVPLDRPDSTKKEAAEPDLDALGKKMRDSLRREEEREYRKRLEKEKPAAEPENHEEEKDEPEEIEKEEQFGSGTPITI